MAKQTRQARMVLIVVFELRVISLGHKEPQKAQKYSQDGFVLLHDIISPACDTHRTSAAEAAARSPGYDR